MGKSFFFEEVEAEECEEEDRGKEEEDERVEEEDREGD